MKKRTYDDRAEFVTRVTYTREVERYGFHAYLIDEGDRGAIFLCALRWQGPQPRLVIHKFDPGHAEWLALLMEQPAAAGEMKFVGARESSAAAAAQWITHAPSPLLADGVANH